MSWESGSDKKKRFQSNQSNLGGYESRPRGYNWACYFQGSIYQSVISFFSTEEKRKRFEPPRIVYDLYRKSVRGEVECYCLDFYFLIFFLLK